MSSLEPVTAAVKHLIYELIALVGRIRHPTFPSEAHPLYVNLGSGAEPIRNFVNVDFYVTRNVGYRADLRYNIGMPLARVDGIFSEHVFEHLSYAAADRLFRECAAALKPGGTMRIVVPDVGLFAERYAARDEAWFKEWERLMFVESPSNERARRTLKTPLEAISFVTQEYRHCSCWDWDTLRRHLADAGFKSVRRVSFRTGNAQGLFVDSDAPDRRFVSLYVEADTA